jgi:hypothetical protein
MERVAFQFRMNRLTANKSLTNHLEDAKSEGGDLRRIEIRHSEKGARPVLVDFSNEMAPIIPPLKIPTSHDSEDNKSNSRRTLEGSRQNNVKSDQGTKTDSSST